MKIVLFDQLTSLRMQDVVVVVVFILVCKCDV